jgi:hypothetical protein
MSVRLTIFSALLSAATAVTIMTGVGCGTDAKGVDDCRSIEEARCAAAKNCGLIGNVSECQNYYRDQCLHGLGVSPPSSKVIKQCVATIQAAGQCALEGTETAPADCASGIPSNATTAKTTCEIVTNPEETEECAFLTPTADAGSNAAGGTGGGGAGVAAGAAESGDAGGAAGANQ